MTTLLSNPQFMGALGWMFAGAMIIGGVLDGGWRQLAQWIVAGLMYILMQEIVLASVLNLQRVLDMNGVFVGLVGLTYCSGVAFGWLIAYLAKRHVRSAHPDLQEKSNAHPI